ncbi:MAG: hydrolase [Leptospiraceae bacterium]|nr:hydrolase [Leptospiraceae bacterium]
MKDNVQYYHEIHPFIYSMKGGLTNDGKLVNLWSSKQKRERVAELRSLNPKVKIIPTIFRWENPKEKISENIGMNGRNDIRDYHIQVILNEVDTFNFDGIDIDYEGMSCEKKFKFEEFIVLLSKEIKKRGKILSVAVHPKTSSAKIKETNCKGLSKPIVRDFVENWRGPMTHDYRFLAKYADRVKIMAYELHPRKYRDPGPGPQAPNTWLVNIIEYAITRIPTQKLYMAIPTYGYDWALNCKARATAVYYSNMQEILTKHHKKYQPTSIERVFEENKNSSSWSNLKKFIYVHRNKIYEDPTLWYKSGGCDRVAFYMNRKAFEAKMNLLRSYKLGGFSFWQLLEDNDPGINEYLALMLTGKEPPFEKVYNFPQNLTFQQKKMMLEKEKQKEEKDIKKVKTEKGKDQSASKTVKVARP